MNNRNYRYYRSLIAFGYYGGKGRLAAQIRDFLDTKDTAVYVEPFGGSAAVLLNKAPHSKEIYSDLSVALCAFWRCMADKSVASELIGRLYETAYDKAVFDGCRECIDEAEASGKLLNELSGREVMDLVVACFVVYNMSRDNGGRRFSSQKFTGNDAYISKISRLREVADRFEGTEVIHANEFDLLADSRFNNANTMLYLDPPYLPEAVPGVYYRHNLDRAGHIQLLEHVWDMDSKVALSGYDDNNFLYNNILIHSGSRWRRYELENYSTVTRDSVCRRIEVLWCNY